MSDSKKKSFVKSVTWRILGVVCLWIISYIFTGSIPQSTIITFAHHGTFLIVYWLHERAWLKVSVFLKSAIKAFTYEIVIAIPILTLISFIFTGDVFKAVSISVTYTVFKLVLYVIYDEIWKKYVSMQVVYMDMVGDLFHTGHLNAINQARKHGKVVVGVVTDEFVEGYKRKTVMPYSHRAEIISNVKGVESVMRQDNLTTDVLKNMRICNANYFLHGDDWRNGSQKDRREFLMNNNIKIIEIPYTKGVSTTSMIMKIKRMVKG